MNKLMPGIALAAAGGALLAAAFPPIGLWPIAWLALIPTVVAQYRVLPANRSGLAPAVTWWMFLALFSGRALASGSLLMQFLPLVTAVFAGIVTSWERGFHERTGYRYLPLLPALVWVAVEFARHAAGLGTWGFLAYSQHSVLPVVQWARPLGVFGVSLLVATVNFSLGRVVLVWLSHRRVDRLGIVCAVVVLAIAFSGGALTTVPSGQRVAVAAIQPGLPGPEEPTDPSLSIAQLLVVDAAAWGAKLVVWPAGWLRFDPGLDDHVSRLSRENGVYMVVGYIAPGPGGTRNEAAVFDPDGNLIARFGKVHPEQQAGEVFTGWCDDVPVDSGIGRLAAIIGQDVSFTDAARMYGDRGTGILAVLSNDVPASAARQHPQVVFRAVENRLPLVKSDFGYSSAIVDRTGRVVDRSITNYAERIVVVGEVTVGDPVDGLAAGDLIGLLAAIVTACALAWEFSIRPRITERRQGNQASP